MEHDPLRQPRRLLYGVLVVRWGALGVALFAAAFLIDTDAVGLDLAIVVAPWVLLSLVELFVYRRWWRIVPLRDRWKARAWEGIQWVVFAGTALGGQPYWALIGGAIVLWFRYSASDSSADQLPVRDIHAGLRDDELERLRAAGVSGHDIRIIPDAPIVPDHWWVGTVHGNPAIVMSQSLWTGTRACRFAVISIAAAYLHVGIVRKSRVIHMAWPMAVAAISWLFTVIVGAENDAQVFWRALLGVWAAVPMCRAVGNQLHRRLAINATAAAIHGSTTARQGLANILDRWYAPRVADPNPPLAAYVLRWEDPNLRDYLAILDN
jgi:hypothetical protein